MSARVVHSDHAELQLDGWATVERSKQQKLLRRSVQVQFGTYFPKEVLVPRVPHRGRLGRSRGVRGRVQRPVGLLRRVEPRRRLRVPVPVQLVRRKRLLHGVRRHLPPRVRLLLQRVAQRPDHPRLPDPGRDAVVQIHSPHAFQFRALDHVHEAIPASVHRLRDVEYIVSGKVEQLHE